MICGAKAVLIVTRAVEGTTTNVVQRRAELSCDKPAGHGGPHESALEGAEWQSEPGKLATVLRHDPALGD